MPMNKFWILFYFISNAGKKDEESYMMISKEDLEQYQDVIFYLADMNSLDVVLNKTDSNVKIVFIPMEKDKK
jgi:hypothetical protein